MQLVLLGIAIILFVLATLAMVIPMPPENRSTWGGIFIPMGLAFFAGSFWHF
ncbi:MAG TPA: hypothetical protein VFK47_06860 [Ktedonobacteraceae bacterium]|nr:hypothetical protein [Ktedonobacteraceae bacterium]